MTFKQHFISEPIHACVLHHYSLSSIYSFLCGCLSYLILIMKTLIIAFFQPLAHQLISALFHSLVPRHPTELSRFLAIVGHVLRAVAKLDGIGL